MATLRIEADQIVEAMKDVLPDAKKAKKKITDYVAFRAETWLRNEANHYALVAGYTGTRRQMYIDGLKVERGARGDAGSITFKTTTVFSHMLEVGWAPPPTANGDDGLGQWDGNKHDMRPWLLGHESAKTSKDGTRYRYVKMSTTGTRREMWERAYNTLRQHRSGDAWALYKKDQNDVYDLVKPGTPVKTTRDRLLLLPRSEDLGMTWWASREATQKDILQAYTSKTSKKGSTIEIPRQTEARSRAIASEISQRLSSMDWDSPALPDVMKTKFSGARGPRGQRGIIGAPMMKPHHRRSIFGGMQLEATAITGRKKASKEVNIYSVFRTVTDDAEDRHPDSWHSEGFKPIGMFQDSKFQEEALDFLRVAALGRLL